MPEDNRETDQAPAIPPKLNLRKSGILKPTVPKEDEGGSGEPQQSGETAPSVHAPDAHASDAAGPTASGQEPVDPARASAPDSAAGVATEAQTSRQREPAAKPAIVIAPPREGDGQTLRINQQTLANEKKAAAAAALAATGAASEPAPKPDAKKKTSRISLDAAVPKTDEPGKSGAPKTIRIKPAGGPAPIKIAPAGGQQTSSEADDEKRKTSRISLESVLGQEAGQSPGAPKTIKLKRPADSGTIRVAKPESETVSGDTASPSSEDAMRKTARLDNVAENAQGPSPTRRKTIRVKRPAQRPGVSTTGVTVARTGGTAPEFRSGTLETGADEPHWVFPLIAAAAAIVAGVLVYMLAAQALAPDVDLSWPGKIQTLR